ncbi:MAG: hypothetical protein Q8M92_05325 [Candidatus Subteraquimicrobiales bacterium]|nr:hypothetical protein [Candidatus Subteraquimicrobiales bacterium]
MHNWKRSAGFFLCLLWGFFVALNWGILAQIIDIFFPAGQRVQIPFIKKFFDEMYSIYAVLFALLWAVAQAVIGIVFEEMRRANHRGAWWLLGLDVGMVLAEMGGGVYRAYLVSGGEINTMTIIAMAVSGFLSGVVPVVAIICGVIGFERFLKPVFFHEVSQLFSNMWTYLEGKTPERIERQKGK